MSFWFWLVTLFFAVVAVVMILVILVQRPQGGGLAGAFGGAGGAGTDTVFGGRVGDALTWATVAAFATYLTLAILLNRLDDAAKGPDQGTTAAAVPTPGETPSEPAPDGGG